MRTYEERKAEIFRRSEKRIRKRKRAFAVLLSSLPLVCVILLSVLVLPAMSPENEADTGEIISESAGQYTPQALAEAQEQGGGGEYRRYTDRETIAKIRTAIEEVTGSNTYDKISPGEQTNDMTENRAEMSNSRKSGYTIKFTDGDGNTVTYILTKYSLYDCTVNREFLITAEQYGSMMEILGFER